ncbi:MAG: hypothetical protein HQK89_10395 [Nitrospirae bacterium]|nr:hypothetical protein [Nitrospirota bacterium]
MIHIDYDMIIFKEGYSFVAYCPELDISSCGNCAEHAREMLKTAIILFIEEAEKMGTLEKILTESNFNKDDNGRFIPAKVIATELVSI